MRKIKKTTILTPPTLKLAAEGVRELLGGEVVQYMNRLGYNLEADLAYMAVAERCRAAREGRGASLKDMALSLRVPKYRLRTMEAGRVNHIDGELLFVCLPTCAGDQRVVQEVGQTESRSLPAALKGRSALAPVNHAFERDAPQAAGPAAPAGLGANRGSNVKRYDSETGIPPHLP